MYFQPGFANLVGNRNFRYIDAMCFEIGYKSCICRILCIKTSDYRNYMVMTSEILVIDKKFLNYLSVKYIWLTSYIYRGPVI